MILFILVCNILCISTVCSTQISLLTRNNITSGSVENVTNKSSTTVQQLDKLNITKTNLLLSEGGIVDPLDSNSASKNHTNRYDWTIDDTEIKQTSVSKVKPRKGVDLLLQSSESKNVTDSSNKKHTSFALSHNTTMSPNKLKNINEQLNSTTKSTNSSAEPTVTNYIHKPTVLSYDKLVSLEKTLHMDSQPYIKGNPNDINKNSALVMPIVITILVVPMFLVLAYFGVRRGQEAWKNRHYKRMDFLLDGMYND